MTQFSDGERRKISPPKHDVITQEYKRLYYIRQVS